MRTFTLLETNDLNLQKVQDNANRVFKSILADHPIVAGRIIDGIYVQTGTPTVIEHGLRRNPYYIVILKDANSVIWDSQATNDQSQNTLILNSSANVTISIWIF